MGKYKFKHLALYDGIIKINKVLASFTTIQYSICLYIYCILYIFVSIGITNSERLSTDALTHLRCQFQCFFFVFSFYFQFVFIMSNYCLSCQTFRWNFLLLTTNKKKGFIRIFVYMTPFCRLWWIIQRTKQSNFDMVTDFLFSLSVMIYVWW